MRKPRVLRVGDCRRSEMAVRLSAAACALGAKAGATVIGVGSLAALGVTLAGGSSHHPTSKVVGGPVVVSTEWPVFSQPPWTPSPSPAKSAKKSTTHAATHAATHASQTATHPAAKATPQPPANAVLAAAIQPAPTTPAAAPDTSASPTARAGWWHGAPPTWTPSPPSPSPSPTCQSGGSGGPGGPGGGSGATTDHHPRCPDPTPPAGPGPGDPGGLGGHHHHPGWPRP